MHMQYLARALSGPVTTPWISRRNCKPSGRASLSRSSGVRRAGRGHSFRLTDFTDRELRFKRLAVALRQVAGLSLPSRPATVTAPARPVSMASQSRSVPFQLPGCAASPGAPWRAIKSHIDRDALAATMQRIEKGREILASLAGQITWRAIPAALTENA
jgi:hypothetical protein